MAFKKPPFNSGGQLIVTKSVGYLSDDSDNDYADITDTYKHLEGSVEERSAMMKAARATGGAALRHEMF